VGERVGERVRNRFSFFYSHSAIPRGQMRRAPRSAESRVLGLCGFTPRCSGPRRPFKLPVEALKHPTAGKFLGKLHLNL